MDLQLNSEEVSSSPINVLVPSSVSASTLPTDMIYNVADGAERNPDVLRAEIALLNTPINQAYAMDAYIAVKNVQDQCAIDYKSYCATAPTNEITIDQFFDQIFAPRRLTSNGLAVESAGASVVNSLKSFVGVKKADVPKINKVSHVQFHENASKLKELTGKRSLRKAKRGLQPADGPPPFAPGPIRGNPNGPPPQGPFGHAPPAKQLESNGPPHGGLFGRAAPPPREKRDPRNDGSDFPKEGPGGHNPPRDGPEGHGPPRDGPEGRGPPKQGPDGHGPPPPPPPPPHEDVFFSGAMGFGASGDMCMYQHLNTLSEPCVGSIASMYQLREDYWNEADQGHHHCGGFIFLMIGILGFLAVRRCMWRKKVKKVRNFMAALHANPALKATVEAETGLEVPLMCGMRGNARPGVVTPYEVSEAPQSKPSWCCQLVYLLSIFALSFFISTSSLHITGHIVENMDQQAVEHDGPGTTALGAVTILMMVIFVQVAFFSLLIKGMQKLYSYAFPVAVAEVCDDYQQGPSAPPVSPKGGITHSSVVQHNALVNSTSGRTWHRLTTFDPSTLFTTRNTTSSAGYEPLLSSESEMVSVTAPQVFQNGAAMPQQHIVVMPYMGTKGNMV